MNPSHHLEVERKFDVVNATAPPSFDGVTGVTRVQQLPAQTLDAVYFDTPAHELAARRITLRRRSGGADEGWHLKLPAKRNARTEIHAPLSGGDTVPPELTDIVLGVVRDHPLAPVARITTMREVALLYGGGDVAAEFCDDHVTGRTMPGSTEQRWREWEVELVDGEDHDLLDRISGLLLDAGAAPAGHGSKLARVLDTAAPADAETYPDRMHRALAEQVDKLLVTDRAVREDADDAVHQLRVTIRKIRSLARGAPVSDELRWLAGLLGVARDAEVLAMRYRQALSRLPSNLVRGPVVADLVDANVQRYRDGWRQALNAMRSPRYFRLLDELDRLVAEPPADAAGSPATLEAAYRRVRKAAKAARNADGADRDKALHRIRKRAKRLRYTAAAIGATRVAAQAKVIQSLLGDHQDSVVSRGHLLARAAAAHSDGADTFTYGLLHQQEDDLARRCRGQLDEALYELGQAVGGRVGL